MIWIYRILYIPVFLISFPYYLWRMLRRGGYAKNFHYRFGLIKPLPEKKLGITRIWIQAVSVGEVNAIKPLIEKLLEKKNVEIIVTTTTSTSYAIAKEQYSDKITAVGIFPLDFWFFSQAAWKRINPDIAILMEAELWPEHIHQATIRNVPVLLINARLSDRSFKRYLKFKFIAKRLILKFLSSLVAGTEQDLDRFVAIGVKPENALCSGNIKFDVNPKKILFEKEKMDLKREMGFVHERSNLDSPCPLILMGSSTWSGEEALLLEIFEKAMEQGIDCRLLVVPRHAERREEIKALLRTQNHTWHLRSVTPQAPEGTFIYVGDTTGELSILTQVADIVFIGKSLPPHNGGQTPIEPAALGIAMVYGPFMTNFRQVCKSLEKADASIMCRDAKEVEEQILALLKDQQKRDALGLAAKHWHALNQGATDKTIAIIEKFMK